MMMMTGRVLLVCVLCVLWCGVGGCAEESAGGVLPGASGSGTGSLQESQRIVPEVLKNPGLNTSDIKDKPEETPIKVSLTEQGEISDDDEGEDEEEGTPTPKTPQGGGVQPQADNGKLKKDNESEPQKESQRHVEFEKQNPSEKEKVDEAERNNEKEAIGPQPQRQEIPVQERDTRNGEGDQLTQGNEGQTIVEEITPHNPAGDHPSGEHKGSDGSKEMEEVEGGVEGHEGGNERHRDQVREEAAHAAGAPKLNSTDIQQEVQRTHAGETPTGIKQKAEEEKDDETEEEREQQKQQNQENPTDKEQEFTSGANATNTIITTPGDSDGSTAVSHTTSPLLLLLAVACAAAAVVAA
ncbi:Mucin-associated surface protein (MASP), subgroup S049 [Trypanosoma cruzi]|nr:Mucin-associated surface protein (MASP), subgroup S049 [Trypanosoma cruzi]